MTKHLDRMVLTGLLFSRAAIPRTRMFARSISTIQKMPEPCDLFEYTSGRWMYVANHHFIVLSSSADLQV